MPNTTSDAIQIQLERARRELLDLSARNRLLNTPRHRKRARSLEVVDELSDEVFRILVPDHKRMGFKPAPEHESIENTADLVEGDIFGDLSPPDEEDLDERGIASRHRDTWLQTQLIPQTLQKRLLQLNYGARTTFEEQGVNILYLALGMLEWYEADSSDRERYAPLILIPVDLERGSALQQFRLSWSQEEIASNLSLIERLKTDFGIELPEVPEIEDLNPSEYFETVGKMVASQRRFTVHPNDIVLGFFSFAKFLMYRDLDPANWPEGAKLSDHAIIRGLLQDGFRTEPSVIGDDEPIDPHVNPRDMVHALDADSSQTVAIEQAKHGRNLVIQGPPGTGKSQTITNLIAMAIAEGRKVLFVAEKMAALEVVKRRLDNIGLGDMCLELHSRKANKRDVLTELERTLDLGRPEMGDLDDLVARMTAARDRLNEHAGRLHARLDPSGETPFHIMGHLIRLSQAGVAPADFTLPEPESWLRQEFRERRGLIDDLSRRIEEIGVPSNHPWRGVGLEAVLPVDIARLSDRIATLRSQLTALISSANQLREVIGCDAFNNSAKGIAVLVNTALRVVEVPEGIDAQAFSNPIWAERRTAISDLVAAGNGMAESRSKLEGIVVDAAWSTDMTTARGDLAAYGKSWLRLLNARYRRASAMLRGILAGSSPKALGEQLQIIDTLITGQRAERAIGTDDVLGTTAFGKLWRRDKSDWGLLEAIDRWDRETHEQPIPDNFRTIIERVVDRTSLRKLATEIGGSIEPLIGEFHTLFSGLKLDIQQAFDTESVETISLDGLVNRLEEWSARSEDISRWIVYRTRTEGAIRHDLGLIVERLYDGRLSPTDAVDAFEMAYYEALMRVVIEQQPMLASFDGQEQQRIVEEFRMYDQQRIELAREEVLFAHYQGLPRANSEIGQVGLLHREFAKRRRHLPIRRLMKEAGLAIQAIKPVFMMSPLSIAQFLEPGALRFDLLLIDEASQVQPVDALGAIARADQIVVVGDDKQLPPTRFFARILAEEDDEEENVQLVSVGDIESILGLCSAQGIHQSMLRWHYRSRHPSLVAVSNHEFYDDRLFVVPSPHIDRPELGLRFSHFPDGMFDSGGTGTNRVEAKAVAHEVIEHARNYPEFSLGVGCFSVRQRDAILDELEHLWRTETDVKDFFAPGGPEPFFVKNLENIQGDERDVIFISIGYARNKSGYMAMRFGPVSAEGGERRLNVLITRARQRCEVFSSITADDIDLERGRGRGVAALKAFLQFAQTGTLGVATATHGEFDSPFEEEVARALAGLGYLVEGQIGIAGFLVDLAIKDSDRPGRYLLGIECDGAAYHSARWARDRDRLRQQVLEDHGWIIHRIWSTDWFQRPEEQLRATVAAIEVAKAEWAKRDRDLAERTQSKHVSRKTQPVRREKTPFDEYLTGNESNQLYQEAKFGVPQNQEPHEVSTNVMAGILTGIIEIEGPIHAAEIARRVASLWGRHRTGNRIVAAVNKGILVAVKSNKIHREGDFYSPAGEREPVIRDRSQVHSLTLKKPEMLPPAEIRAALQTVVKENFGVSREEAITVASRLFGFKVTSSQLRDTIDAELKLLLKKGKIVEDSGSLKVV